MSGRLNDYKVHIDWKKVKHIRPKIEKDGGISLEIKPTTSNLPYVTVITSVSDPVLFGFCMYSWNSVLYPRHLLNWVILDPNDYLSQSNVSNVSNTLIDDKNVKIIKKKYKTFNHAVSEILENESSRVSPEGFARVEPSTLDIKREHYFTLMECGDVWFPDTLSLKFRALKEGYDCVIADTLAYYSPIHNTSLAYKLFLKYPRGGLYFKKSWWKSKSSSNMVGVPYLANAVTIGKPFVQAIPVEASVRFFDNFPADVKEMIKKIMAYVESQNDF